MNERQIQLGIVNEIRSAIVVAAPNYTPRGWWECDLWAVTKAGYAVEYEIKLTLSDFKADSKKCSERGEWVGGMMVNWRKMRKHDAMSESKHGPSRYFYVVPKALRAEVEPLLPAWAGLGIAHEWVKGHVLVRFVRESPRLHNRKVGTREIRLCQTRMWYRYWNLLGVRERQGVPEVAPEVAEVLEAGGGA